MDVSGTLHFYSGADRELFFVFDDDIAQRLYQRSDIDIADIGTRRVLVGVGQERCIDQRTMSLSRKQTEIKVSLCSRNTKDNRGALTTLYNWFDAQGAHPEPFRLLGVLTKRRQQDGVSWELVLKEPEGLVSPPGMGRRRKDRRSRTKRAFEHRREIVERDLLLAAKPAEKLALEIAREDWAAPEFACLWRDGYFDSERSEIRELGIIADIDVWNQKTDAPTAFIEVKAQRVRGRQPAPLFFLSNAEWRSFEVAKVRGIPYQVWLFQYTDVNDFDSRIEKLTLLVYSDLEPSWQRPNGFEMHPAVQAGTRYRLSRP